MSIGLQENLSVMTKKPIKESVGHQVDCHVLNKDTTTKVDARQ
jgi:hypothetical protein